jgi:type IV secretory pathway protease TraF
MTAPLYCPRKQRRSLPSIARAILILLSTSLATLWFALPRPQDWIAYNHSPSVPVGLYLRAAEHVGVGKLVTVRARDVAPSYARLRRFGRERDRFLKRVTAGPGDLVCATRDAVIINSNHPILRFANDRQGRALPQWQDCRRLRSHEWFLMGDTPDSFDSRYWGPVDERLIEGVWRGL